jgi:group I intron endonuclease
VRYIVYMHTSPSGKSYIGFTGQRGNLRWLRHVSDAKLGSDTAFHRAMRKYGAASFTHEVLDRLATEEGAKRAEMAWIREMGTSVPAGYNISLGGDGYSGKGRVASAEVRARLSEAHKGKRPSGDTRARMTEAQRRRWAAYTDAERTAIAGRSAASRRGAKRTPEQCARIAEATRAAIRRKRAVRGG